MNTHYIPRLLLKQFGDGNKVNSYDFELDSMSMKKMKHVFAENDLYPEELEKLFAEKLEFCRSCLEYQRWIMSASFISTVQIHQESGCINYI